MFCLLAYFIRAHAFTNCLRVFGQTGAPRRVHRSAPPPCLPPKDKDIPIQYVPFLRTQQANLPAFSLQYFFCANQEAVNTTFNSVSVTRQRNWSSDFKAGALTTAPQRWWALLLKWKTTNTIFFSLSVSASYKSITIRVAASWLKVFSNVFQSLEEYRIARSSAHAYVLKAVVGRLYLQMLKRRGVPELFPVEHRF